MRDENVREIEWLQEELAQALSGHLEVSLSGSPVEDHRVSVPYLNRVLETLQGTYRAVLKSIAPEKITRAAGTLAVAGTAPGSFKVSLSAPTTQLELMDEPITDRGMGIILDLLTAAEAGEIGHVGPEWAARVEEGAVRSMIRLAAALASSRGTTHVRWRAASGEERLVAVTADAARSLAASLAGEAGREIISVTGHLEMAQDRPPRIRVTTDDDDYVAAVNSPEMLDLVRDLLFGEIRATLVIDMRTSPTTGSPGVDIELLDLEGV
jgi:hypothetical protein